MRKHLILAFLSLCMPLLLVAQTVDNSARNYSVRYEKEHLFMQKDSDFNVVDYDVEWPEIVSYNAVEPLKRYISNSIFDFTTQDLDSALTNLDVVYGKEVKGKLKTIPDDNHFCYVNIQAKILSYNPERWIAYSLKRTVQPQKLSSYKPEEQNRVIIYDLQKQRVLLADDVLNKEVMNWAMPDDFYDRLFAPIDSMFANSDGNVYYNLQKLQINGVWIDGGKINMLVDAFTDNENFSYNTSMPYEAYRYALTKDARRLVEKAIKPQTPQFISLPVTWKGDTIYNKVEQMPQFKGGDEGLRRYLSYVSKPTVSLREASRVYVTFVVDKQGNIKDVSVVSPVTPRLDEHAVSVVRGMPAFTPGKQNDKPVCVRMLMPINYKP